MLCCFPFTDIEKRMYPLCALTGAKLFMNIRVTLYAIVASYLGKAKHNIFLQSDLCVNFIITFGHITAK